MDKDSWSLTISIVSAIFAGLALTLNYRTTKINAKKYKEETHGKLKADFSIKREGDRIIIKNNGSEALIKDIFINGKSIAKQAG